MHQKEYTPHSFSDRTPLFEVQDLCYRYGDGRKALEGISLTVYAGDRIALAGHNGAGKTTFIKHLNGLYRPERGHVAYRGSPLDAPENLRLARTEIGILFQDPDDQLFSNTLYEDIAFGPLNQGISAGQADALVKHAAACVDLADLLHRPPHQLSYGQKKRAALATVLSMRPQVLVLDEPTANLDSRQERLLWDLIQDFAGTLIVISHDLEFLYGLCDRAVVFERGRIHHDFTMRELVSQPALMRSHGLDFNFRFHCCQDGDPVHHHHNGHTHDHSRARQHESHTHDHSHEHHHHGAEGTSREDAGPSGPVDRHHTPAHEKTGMPPAAENGSLISIEDYSFRYPGGIWGLRDVTLAIRRGEDLAIVGENGAGKSTLAHCLVGVLSGEGTHLFLGKPVKPGPKSQLWRKVGIVFQNPADQLFCPSCAEEVAFGPRQMGLPKGEVRRRVSEALEMVKLEGFDDRVPLHLSAGERKRLAVAAALSMNPEVLILDEPTAHLDPYSEELLVEILVRLPLTKILISHDIPLIRALCQRVAVLHKGKVARDYGLEEFTHDQHLISMNGLDYTYRNHCHEEILALQKAAGNGLE
ncbi:MAG: energy-coupling factor transporter ATPase [Syntrophobacteraceae bacterium]